MKNVYLDHAATTPVDKKVLEAMLPFFNKKFGNASSLHNQGNFAKNNVEKARQLAARALNCLPEAITFTSGATESNNLVIRGLFEGLLENCPRNKKLHFISTTIEHPCILDTISYLNNYYGEQFEADLLEVDHKGFIDLDNLNNKIKDNTVLVSVMFVNNEIGTVQPIDKIGKLIRKVRARRTKSDLPLFFHTDAVQAFPYYKINMQAQNIDLVTLSSHKIYGPKGVGLLAAKQSIPLNPIIYGGGHEQGRRSGTLNVSGIVGFGKAIELIEKSRGEECHKMKKLQAYFIKKVESEIKESLLNGPRQNRSPNNINFSFPGVEGESILLLLDQKGIAVSTGSACSSEKLKSSHVQIAIGNNHLRAHSSIRFTLGKDTTQKRLSYTVNILKDVLKKLKKTAGNVVSRYDQST